MRRLLRIFSFLYLISCNVRNDKDFSASFSAFKYDASIIKELHQYDSLKNIVIPNISNFRLSDHTNDFTYYYNFDKSVQISGYSNEDLPKFLYSKITAIFKALQKNKIYGFNISKDSVFEIFIRNTYLQQYDLDVRERLFWKSNKQKFEKSVYPGKDTMLTDNWQYQVYFDKRAGF